MKSTAFIFALLLAALSVLPLSARTVYVARHAQVGIGIKEIKETRITPDLGVKQAQALADFLVKKLKFRVKQRKTKNPFERGRYFCFSFSDRSELVKFVESKNCKLSINICNLLYYKILI